MNKAELIRKLQDPFSYLGVEIPETIEVNEEKIDLSKRIDEIRKTSEDGDHEKIVPEIVGLLKLLNSLYSDFVQKVQDSRIQLTEAYSKLGYYLGIRRAMAVLKGISDESLKPFMREKEKKEELEDRKRWHEYLKDLEE